ncbi:MAG: ABC transporter permease, partial [Pseudomonadota bacterium]
PQPSAFWAYLTPVIAVLATMVAGGLMFAALGKDPFQSLRLIFWDPLFGEFAFYYRTQLLIKAGPLILIAIGLSLGFRAGIWNIGAEGQYIMGAIFGAAVGLAFYPLEARWLIFPLMVLFGALGGFLWAMIPALLKTRFNTNEILVSLLLVYVAEQILAMMAFGALRNPDGQGFPGSRNLARWESSQNPELITGTGAHLGVVAAIIAVLLAAILLSRHRVGFDIKLMGVAPKAAAFSGVNRNRMVVLCLGISGGLAGLAGLFEVTGPSGQITDSFNVGYGFTAIIVAFLGRLNPLGILAAGLLIGLTYIGGDAAQAGIGLPGAAIQAFQGMLLFFLLAADLLTQFRIRRARAAA